MFSNLFNDFDHFTFQVPMRRKRTRDASAPAFSMLLAEPEPSGIDDLYGWANILAPRRKMPRLVEELQHSSDPVFPRNSEEEKKSKEVVLKKAGVSSDEWSVVVNQHTLSQFRPEDIEISLEENRLSVSGHRRWQNDDASQKMSRSFSQVVTVPSDVKLNTIRSKVVVGQNGTPQIVIHAEREHPDKKVKQKNKIPVEIIFDPDSDCGKEVQQSKESCNECKTNKKQEDETGNEIKGKETKVGDWPNLE